MKHTTRSASGRPADKSAEGRLLPQAGQANSYPESEWQATTTGYITHVNDGFVLPGHRIIRKRKSNGRMSAVTTVTTIPKEKAKAFVHRLTEVLSGSHDVGTVDMIGSLNRQVALGLGGGERQPRVAGWAAFYKFTDFTARIFRRIDHVVFWKLAHWLAEIYRSRIKPLMRNWYRVPETGKAKTWLVFGRSERGKRVGKALRRMVSSPKAQFRWRNPEITPYIFQGKARSTVTSRYHDVAMAMGQV